MRSLIRGLCSCTPCSLAWELQYPPCRQACCPALAHRWHCPGFPCWLDPEPACHYRPVRSFGLLADLVTAAGAALLFFPGSHGTVPLVVRTWPLPAPLSPAARGVPAWWSSPTLWLLTPCAAAGPFLSCIEVLSFLVDSCRDSSGCKKDYFEGRHKSCFYKHHKRSV